MTYIEWWDPGLRTGYTMGYFSDTQHYEMGFAKQFDGGVPTVIDFLDGKHQRLRADVIGCEKFVPRPEEGHSPTMDSTLPLVIEGVLIGRGVMPPYPEGNWQPSSAMLLRRGKNPAQSLKLSNGLLEEKGLLLTGGDVGCEDADDANSTTKHIIAFLCRRLRHKPTLDWIYGEETP